jgi:type IV secretory pathway TrbD component
MIVQGVIGLLTGILALVTGIIIADWRVALFGAVVIPPSVFTIWWFIWGRPFS